MLTSKDLERFDCALRRAGALAVHHWAPGLSNQQIDEIAGRHGLVLPEEARVLWRWHNGTLRREARGIGPDRSLLPLAEALSDFEESAAMLEGWGSSKLWNPFLGKPIILLDLEHATDEAIPLLVADDWTEEPRASLSSLGDLFAIWTRLLDEGVWQPGKDGKWAGDCFDRVPPDIVELGVY